MWPWKKKKPIEIPSLSSRKAEPLQITEKEVSDAVAKAVGTLYPRIQALNEYNNHLIDVDKSASTFIENLIKQTQMAHDVTIALYSLTYIVALSILIAGPIFIIRKDFSFATVCIISGAILLLVLLNRNPLKNVRQRTNNLVKLNILFMGYSRQIHQMDAVFKDTLSKPEGIDTEVMEKMLGNVQAAVDEVISSITQLTNDMDADE
jgi:hypothetical protein